MRCGPKIYSGHARVIAIAALPRAETGTCRARDDDDDERGELSANVTEETPRGTAHSCSYK